MQKQYVYFKLTLLKEPFFPAPEICAVEIPLMCVSMYLGLQIHLELETHLERKIKNIDEVKNTEWRHLSAYKKLSLRFLSSFENYIHWDTYFVIQNNVSENLLTKFEHKITEASWNYISLCYTYILSEKFIRKYSNKLNWYDLIDNKLCSDTLLRDFSYTFDDKMWELISEYQHPSEEFMEDFFYKLKWDGILQNRYPDYIYAMREGVCSDNSSEPGSPLRMSKDFYLYAFEKFYGRKPMFDLFD